MNYDLACSLTKQYRLQSVRARVCGGGGGGQRGLGLNIALKSVLGFVNNLQTEKLLKKSIPSNRKHNKNGITKGYSANRSGDMIVSIVDGGHFNLVHTGR